MTAHISAYGRLGDDPKHIETRTGTEMAVASLAVDVADGRDADRNTPPLWLRILAFGKIAGTLERHAKGDPVSVAGRLQLNRFTGRDGEAREQWQCVADSIVSARTPRPGGGKRKENGKGDGKGDTRRGDWQAPLPSDGAADDGAPDPNDRIPF